MNKEEYLRTLRRRLSLYPRDFVEEIIETFEAHFEEGKEAGQSEQEVMDDLGTVDQVVDDIRMMNIGTEDHRTSNDAFQKQFQSFSQSFGETMKAAAGLLVDGVQTVAQNLQDDPAEAIFRNVENAENCKGIVVQAMSSNVNVQLVKSDTLQYKFQPKKDLFSRSKPFVTVDVIQDEVHFVIREGKADLTIFMPMEIQNVVLNLTSGDVSANDLSLLSLRVRQTSGDVSFDSMDIIDGDLTSVSGDINLRDVHGAMNLRTTSGDVNLFRCGLDPLTIQTVSGDVECTFQSRDYIAEVSTVSGEFENKSHMRKQKNGPKSWYVGNGIARISIRTVSGDVLIHS